MLQIDLPAGTLETAAPTETATAARWSLGTRLAFRFAFVYLMLWGFPGPLQLVPWLQPVFQPIERFQHLLVAWTAAHVLHLEAPLSFAITGSGDTTASYVGNLLVLALAVLAAAVWSVFEGGRKAHPVLHEWLRLAVRLDLGAILIGYGALKVIKSQFPDPFLWRLLEPYGDSSPMGLLWTFMGYSQGYNVFTGAVEMLAGALVLVPRLTTLGALLATLAMTNVFALNMAYDVPVKIYSLNLVLASLFLLVPEARRLVGVFVLNRVVQPAAPRRLVRSRSIDLALLAGQILFLGYIVSADLSVAYRGIREYGDLSPKPTLYGIYAVDRFTSNGEVRPALFGDEVRWRKVTLERGMMAVLPGEGPLQRYAVQTLQGGKMLLTRRGDASWNTELAVEIPSPGRVLLTGTMDGKLIVAELRKLDERSFNLTSRGFHWINEFPFNR